jgi:hypothetical protein
MGPARCASIRWACRPCLLPMVLGSLQHRAATRRSRGLRRPRGSQTTQRQDRWCSAMKATPVKWPSSFRRAMPVAHRMSTFESPAVRSAAFMGLSRLRESALGSKLPIWLLSRERTLAGWTPTGLGPGGAGGRRLTGIQRSSPLRGPLVFDIVNRSSSRPAALRAPQFGRRNYR